MKKLVVLGILLCFIFSFFNIINVQGAVTKIKPAYVAPVAPAPTNEVIVLGTYGSLPGNGGYYALGGKFLNLLNLYFGDGVNPVSAEIASIDRAIQESIEYNGGTIWDQDANWHEIAGSAYTYNRTTGEYEIGNYYFVKTYTALYDKLFYIDANTGELLATGSTRSFCQQLTGQTGDDQSNWATMGIIGKDVSLNNVNYTVVGAEHWSPIALDLAGCNIIDASYGIWYPHSPKFFERKTVFFDIDGDGMKEYIEWIGPNTGLLVKPNPDGTVTNAHNLFGTAGGYLDGYEKMSVVLDIDKNGWIEGKELEGLYIWIDKNKNGKTDAGELNSVQKLGISRISTSHKDYVSAFYYTDGRKGRMWDWWPSGFKLRESAPKE